jgi:hypothetical protein
MWCKQRGSRNEQAAPKTKMLRLPLNKKNDVCEWYEVQPSAAIKIMRMAGEKSDFSRHRRTNLELMTYNLAQTCNRDRSTGVSQRVGTDAWNFVGDWYVYERLDRAKAAAVYLISVTCLVTVTHTYSTVSQLYLIVYAISIYKQNHTARTSRT